MYHLRVRCLRKFFKTQFITAGLPESHADYMMGHVEDTYNQVHSLGVEKLRKEYDDAKVFLRPSTGNPDEALEQLVKRVTSDPVLLREFLTRLTAVATQNKTSPTLSPNIQPGQCAHVVAPPRGFEPLAAPCYGALTNGLLQWTL
jgi:hypothetical protein